MLNWLITRPNRTRKKGGSSLYNAFLSPDDPEVQKLKRLQEKQTAALSRMTVANQNMTRTYDLKKRISFITRRNKERSILIVHFTENQNLLTSILLNANSNANHECAHNLKEAESRLKDRSFDMVYAVIDMALDGHGPCFFSFENDEEVRSKNSQFDKFYKQIKPLCPDAEVIAICGTSPDKCPIARRLYEEKVEQENAKIQQNV